MRLKLAAYIASDAKTSEDWRKKYDYAGSPTISYYDEDGRFIKPLIPVQLNGKWGFVNTEGKEVVELEYDFVGSFDDGFAMVKLYDEWGFIDTQGVEVVEPKYDRVLDFSDGFAMVKRRGMWGWINTEGEEVVEPKYDKVEHPELNSEGTRDIRFDEKETELLFREGLLRVELNGKWRLVNMNDKFIIPPVTEKEMIQLETLVGTGEYQGTKEQQYNQAHEEFQIWKRKENDETNL